MSPPLRAKEVMDLVGNAFNAAACCAVVTAAIAIADWPAMTQVKQSLRDQASSEPQSPITDSEMPSSGSQF